MRNYSKHKMFMIMVKSSLKKYKTFGIGCIDPNSIERNWMKVRFKTKHEISILSDFVKLWIEDECL